MPIVQDRASGRGLRIEVNDSAADPRSDEHSDAVGDEGDESLCGSAQGLRRFLVYVDLAGDEEKVVADSVQDDSEVEHPDQAAAVPCAEADVAQDPGEHAEHQRVFYAEAAKKPRQRDHEE